MKLVIVTILIVAAQGNVPPNDGQQDVVKPEIPNPDIQQPASLEGNTQSSEGGTKPESAENAAPAAAPQSTGEFQYKTCTGKTRSNQKFCIM